MTDREAGETHWARAYQMGKGKIMSKLWQCLIGATVFGVLVAIGVPLSSTRAEAQGPPDGLAVRIVNPVPVPVTGTSTVSGTVSAAQSGVWNVGITGTPTVR